MKINITRLSTYEFVELLHLVVDGQLLPALEDLLIRRREGLSSERVDVSVLFDKMHARVQQNEY